MTDEEKDTGVSKDEVPEPVLPHIVRGSIRGKEIKQEEPASDVVSDDAGTQPMQFKTDGQLHDYVVPEAKKDEQMVSIPISEVLDMATGRQATVNRKNALKSQPDTNMAKAIADGVAEGLKEAQPAQKVDNNPLALFSTQEQETIKQVYAEGTDEEKAAMQIQITNRQAAFVVDQQNKTLLNRVEAFEDAVVNKEQYEVMAALDDEFPIHNPAGVQSYLDESGFTRWAEIEGMGSVPQGNAYKAFLKDTGKNVGDDEMPANDNASGDANKISQQTAMKKVVDQVGTPEGGATIGRETDDKEIRKALATDVKAAVRQPGADGERAREIWREKRGLPPMDD